MLFGVQAAIDLEKTMSEFRAGAAELDITPWLGVSLAGHFADRFAEDIDDPLMAKALVLDDGSTRLAMVVLDLIGLEIAEVQTIRSMVASATDIPADHVMIACTHTHTGPTVRASRGRPREEAYVQWMVRRVADVVRLADRRLQPARLATGAGELHGVSFCRRYRMKDGTVVTNPGRGNPNVVEPINPIDPEVGIVYVEDLGRQPLAVLAQFSLHYVGTDNARHVSADYYGHFARAVRQILGQQCVPMLMNGTSGQINNIDVFNLNQLKGHQQARRVAVALAAEVTRVIATLTPQDTCTLAVAVEDITLARKRVTLADVQLAEQMLAQSDPVSTVGRFSYVVGAPIPVNMCTPYARNAKAVYDSQDEPVNTQVQALRIGDAGWMALPGEIFVEIGLAIKAQSVAPRTFVVGLANDSLGYVATDQALLHEGGYETWASLGNPVGLGAEAVIREAALRTLQKVFRQSDMQAENARTQTTAT